MYAQDHLDFPPSLRIFTYRGVILEAEQLKYAPHPDIIHPSVVPASAEDRTRGINWYLYYAPHDKPGGICLATSTTLDGPWQEVPNNPLIGPDWPPHYAVSHVSSPHALWLPGKEEMILYFHGENSTTRFATSANGRDFTYGDVAVTVDDFEPGLTEASYARVFPWQPKVPEKAFLMLLMGNCEGTRNVYAAFSPDGKQWTARPDPLLRPPEGYSQMGPGWVFEEAGDTFIIAFANRAECPTYQPISDLFLYRIDPDSLAVELLGSLMPAEFAGENNQRINDPCLIQGPNGKHHLFVNVGHRLHQKIALITTG